MKVDLACLKLKKKNNLYLEFVLLIVKYSNLQVLIIGGGPCGLRAAVEICLLGGQPILVEKRDYFSRYNVANLWEFVVKDLKSIGAKVLQKDLCVRHDRASK